jgi:hypothetical protein
MKSGNVEYKIISVEEREGAVILNYKRIKYGREDMGGNKTLNMRKMTQSFRFLWERAILLAWNCWIHMG